MSIIKVGKITKSGEILRDFFRQGNVFKDGEAYAKKQGVCYVPELNDYKYTYNDFLTIANNNEAIADLLFEYVDWQSPETLYDEWYNEDEIMECETCKKSFLTDGQDDVQCPFCTKENNL